jgi:hypothetical protein
VAGPKQGDKVEWNTSQGRTTGSVVSKLTTDTNGSGRSRSSRRR